MAPSPCLSRTRARPSATSCTASGHSASRNCPDPRGPVRTSGFVRRAGSCSCSAARYPRMHPLRYGPAAGLCVIRVTRPPSTCASSGHPPPQSRLQVTGSDRRGRTRAGGRGAGGHARHGGRRLHVEPPGALHQLAEAPEEQGDGHAVGDVVVEEHGHAEQLALGVVQLGDRTQRDGQRVDAHGHGPGPRAGGGGERDGGHHDGAHRALHAERVAEKAVPEQPLAQVERRRERQTHEARRRDAAAARQPLLAGRERARLRAADLRADLAHRLLVGAPHHERHRDAVPAVRAGRPAKHGEAHVDVVEHDEAAAAAPQRVDRPCARRPPGRRTRPPTP